MRAGIDEKSDLSTWGGRLADNCWQEGGEGVKILKNVLT